MFTLHLISHTHWDREWYLPLQAFRLKLVWLMDRLLALFASDPAYQYFMLDGQTIVLDDYLMLRPEREEEIRGYVQSGRLLIGPWHILPDEFLVSPEATVRNLLQGERTACRFGAKMTVGYIPDPFGHIGQMPQILRGFGITRAALRRGLADEPCELWWQAPDGSRVFLAYLRDGYDNAAQLPMADPDDLQPFVAAVRWLRDSLAPHTTTKHILLMHGTDHMEPQPHTSAALAYARGKLDGDVLFQSTLPVYLEAVQSAIRDRQLEIPTVVGELRSPKRHHLLPGVLSTRMWIKQRNRSCETLLEKWAEPFNSWVGLLDEADEPGETSNPPRGSPSLAPILRRAWYILMECHPHDSICGCSVDQVHDEMRLRFDQVEQIGEEVVRQSLAAIAAAADTRAGEASPEWSTALVVFNPASGPRTDAVAVEVELPSGIEEIEVVDEAGTVLAHRLVGQRSRELEFVAQDVPGYGYRTFGVRSIPPSPSQGSSSRAGRDRKGVGGRGLPRIENEHVVVEVSPTDGTLTVTDKHTGVRFAGLNRFVDGGDCGDEYNYCPPAEDTIVVGPAYATPRFYVQGDGFRRSLEVAYEMPIPAGLAEDRGSRSSESVLLTVRTVASLVPGVPRVDVVTEVENRARDHRLRVHFPVPFAVAAADYDGHYQVVRRPVGLPPYDGSWVEQPRLEVPQRAFVDVSDGSVGLTVANRGLPEVAVLPTPSGATEVALTLLRCVGWLSRGDLTTRRGHAGPAVPTPGAQMIGRHRFEYAIIPHSGGWQNAYRQAYAFAAPMRAVVTPVHAGTLPGTAALVWVDPGEFVLSAMKTAEDGHGLIVRGYNIGAEPIGVTLTPWRKFARAARVRLDEEAGVELALSADGSVRLTARGHEVVSVRFYAAES